MNIIDYLKMRSDISFKYDPFNEVDNLCLSQCAYANLEKAFKNINTVLSFKEAAKIVLKGVSDEDILKEKSFTATSAFVLRELAQSERYKDVKLHHFVSTLDNKNNEQFCALQFDIDKNLTYVAFRGTDSTIVGWKEDFKISYEITKAQEAAVNYLNSYLDGKKKYLIGGHSKGGNLALYASIKADKKIQDKIATIYNNDGPGLNRESMGKLDLSLLYDRTVQFVPEDDLFGTIYDNSRIKHIIVKSNAEFVMQHDAMTWLVETNHFVYAKKVTAQSKVIKNALNDFMKQVDVGHRKLFFEAFFEALDELKVDHVTDLNKVTIMAFAKAIGKIIAMNDESKKVALEFGDVLIDLVKYEADEAKEKIESMIVNQKNAIDKTINSSKTKVKKAIKRIKK